MKKLKKCILVLAVISFGCNTGINPTLPKNNFIGKWQGVYCLNEYIDSTHNLTHDTVLYFNNSNSILNAYLEINIDTLLYYAYLTNDSVYRVSKFKYIISNDSLLIVNNINSLYDTVNYLLNKYSYLVNMDSLIASFNLLLKTQSNPNYYPLFPNVISSVYYSKYVGNIPPLNWPNKPIIIQ
jgi:hypothetical protein